MAGREEITKKGARAQRGGLRDHRPLPIYSAGRSSLPHFPTSIEISSSFPSLLGTFLTDQPCPMPHFDALPLRPFNVSGTQLQAHSHIIPAAPSTSAHRRLPCYPESRCLAHRVSPAALVLKRRKGVSG